MGHTTFGIVQFTPSDRTLSNGIDLRPLAHVCWSSRTKCVGDINLVCCAELETLLSIASFEHSCGHSMLANSPIALRPGVRLCMGVVVTITAWGPLFFPLFPPRECDSM